MMLPLVPQNAFGLEGGLLTALVIGFVFGFALERAGFGNARKLAAQFYFYDMTVFKVMFTAIITAMSGLFALAAWGMVDLSLVWINPTFLGPQLVGGFLLGAGFLISGLCPGTGFVSLASGKTDAFFALLGVFLGTLLFALALEAVPAFNAFYTAPGSGTVLLHDLLHVPAPWLALGVVLMALGCFVGAEKLERVFERKLDIDPASGRERSRVDDKRGKYILAGGLAVLCIAAGLTGGAPAPSPALAAVIQPLEAGTLAEALIRREAGWLMLDLRAPAERELIKLPGAQPVDKVSEVPAALLEAPEGTRVLLIGTAGLKPGVPAGWPSGRDYLWLSGGTEAWQARVLTPAMAGGTALEERERVARQNQIAAYFSGAEVAVSAAAPPPPPAGGGGGAKKKKAGGGC